MFSNDLELEMCFGKWFFKHRKGKGCVSVNVSLYISVNEKKNVQEEKKKRNCRAPYDSNSQSVDIDIRRHSLKHAPYIAFYRNAGLLEQQAH